MRAPTGLKILARLLAPAVVVTGIAFSLPAGASPTVFFGIDNSFIPAVRTNADLARDGFVAAVGAGSITTQDYESAALGDLAPVTVGTLSNGVGVTVTNTATNYLRISSGIGAFDTHPTSGSRYLETLSDQGSTYFTAVFDKAVRGIGFYVTDASDWIGNTGPIDKLKVVLTTANGPSVEFDLTPGVEPAALVSGNAAFFGVFDDANPFTSIAIRSPGTIPGGDALGFDDFMVSVNSVPVPGTLVLLLSLLPAFGFLRRPEESCPT